MTQVHPGYWDDGSWWWIFFHPLFWIPFWILVFLLVRGLFWRRYRRHHHGWHPGWHPGLGHGEHDPRTILAQRYARGEISEQEYRERLAVLTAPPSTPQRK